MCVDADLSILPQDPTGSFLRRDGDTVHQELLADANYNPAGARLNQMRYHLVVGLYGNCPPGDWAKHALTRKQDDILRGFLRGEAFLLSPRTSA